MYNNNFPQGMFPMNQPNNGAQMPVQMNQMKHMCEQYLDYYVTGQMTNGSQVEGILEDVDDEGVTMMVPEDVPAGDDMGEMNMNDMRLYGFGGYGGYGRPRRRFRRFRRRRFPFSQFVFPIIIPFPFYY